MMKRRQLIQWASALAATGALPQALAQAGQGPVRILVGFAAGGSTDILARQLAEQMKTVLGRPVIVENKTGAAGRLAVEAIKLAAADGDTLLLAPHGAMTLFPHIYKSLRYEPSKDFTPITRVSASDYGIAVNAAAPARDLAGFKAWAASQGDQMAFGSPGSGTVLHFLGMQIGRGLGLKLTHVPYRGAAPAIADLLGGSVQAVVTPLGDLLEMHKAGKLRVLATTGHTRSRLIEGVPTARESGVDLDVAAWTGLYGPAGMAPSVRDGLHAAAVRGLQADAMQARLQAIGMSAAPCTPAELAELQRKESALWADAVAQAGFTPEN